MRAHPHTVLMIAGPHDVWGRLDPHNQQAADLIAGLAASCVTAYVDEALVTSTVERYLATFSPRPPIEQILGKLLAATVPLERPSRYLATAVEHPLRDAVMRAVIGVYYPVKG